MSVDPRLKRELRVWDHPQVEGGEPVVRGTLGVTIPTLLDRIDAGDSIQEVAEDFGVEEGSLELLVEVREALKFRPETGNGLDGLQHPDCRACEERKRLSVGQLAEIKALRARVAELERGGE